ncbi:MAG: signal peptide peptidase SppA [Chloroflexota bacterium]
MKRSTFFWIGGIFLFMLFGCVGLFVLVSMMGSMTIGGSSISEFEPVEGDAVALIRIEGTILPGEGGTPNPFNPTVGAFSQSIIDHLQRANEDEQVKAIVLVVDTPGGSVYASDEIALQVDAMDKPVVAAMGSMAASGGYYVSAVADEIWASPHTLTCSIGVIVQFLNYSELAQEYGVKSVVFKSGEYKDTGNAFRDITEEEAVIWQSLIDEAYDAFVAIVAEGRGLSEGTVREVADGRICTGKQAQEMQLVDEMGYLPDAIKRAGELGGIDGDDPPVKEYFDEPSLFDVFTTMMNRPSPVSEVRQLIEYRPGATLMYFYSGW